MSAWRRQALSHLPECRAIINAADNPMAMWIELHLEFERAMEVANHDLVGRFMQFAAWCISEESGKLPNDTSTAVACAFYEHLPETRKYWPNFPKWFSRSQFEMLLPVFSYHLSPDDFADLKKHYAAKA